MKRELTCIRCPLGCHIEVELDGKRVISVTGNTCPRGAEYAESECVNPVRIVTTTVLNQSGIPVPVKTATPIPKDKIFDCMMAVNKIVVPNDAKIGYVAAENIFGSDVVVTAEAIKGAK